MSRLGEAPQGAVYIEEKAVYMNNIHSKTIQWETRKKSCSIIRSDIYIPIWLTAVSVGIFIICISSPVSHSIFSNILTNSVNIVDFVKKLG